MINCDKSCDIRATRTELPGWVEAAPAISFCLAVGISGDTAFDGHQEPRSDRFNAQKDAGNELRMPRTAPRRRHLAPGELARAAHPAAGDAQRQRHA
jgi:hypothetical protein